MKYLITGKYAHRVLNNGQVESAPVTYNDDGTFSVSNDFKVRDPKEMNVVGSHLVIIGNVLLNMRNLIAEQADPVIQAPPKVGQSAVGVA